MRRSRQALSDAEITRRAAVNPQYLQRHRDLKGEAETIRAHLAQNGPRAAAAATARKEAALEVENRMLLEQNAALQRTLQEVQNELRTVRANELGARLRDGLNVRSLRDTEMEELREQRDAALAASRQAETAMQALRNVNQRLMVENSRLIAADIPGPAQGGNGDSSPADATDACPPTAVRVDPQSSAPLRAHRPQP